MDRKRAQQLLPIIQAFAEGKTIECCQVGCLWETIKEPTFNTDYEYRIKLEPREFYVHKYDFIDEIGLIEPDLQENWIKVREVLE